MECSYEAEKLFLRGRETVPSMQLLAPHKENCGQKASILDAAIRYALQRIARFASGTLLGNNYSAAYGHVRSCYLSAAQCLEAACSSSPVWQYVAARTCSPSSSACSSVAVISSVDTVLFAKQLLFRCPRALCEPSINPDLTTHRCSRRRLFSRLLSWLPGNLSCVNLGSLQLRWNGPHRTVVRVTKDRPGGEKTVCTDGCRQTADFTSTESSDITCTLDQRCQIELDTPLRVLALDDYTTQTWKRCVSVSAARGWQSKRPSLLGFVINELLLSIRIAP